MLEWQGRRSPVAACLASPPFEFLLTFLKMHSPLEVAHFRTPSSSSRVSAGLPPLTLPGLSFALGHPLTHPGRHLRTSLPIGILAGRRPETVLLSFGSHVHWSGNTRTISIRSCHVVVRPFVIAVASPL